MNNVPVKVKEIINQHIDIIEANLPNLLEGYSIYGSVVLGAFNYGVSDIDFIAVVKREVTETYINILKEIHSHIKNKFTQTDLMGLYVMKNDLTAQYENKKTCPCFIDGMYKGLDKFEKDSIDAFQLKKYGITVKGQDIQNYDYVVNWDILLYNMIDNLNTYWLNWKNDYEKFSYDKLSKIDWGVLGVSRLYYTFKERDITSKIGAGEYALRTVPKRWHKIIKESMRLREGNTESYYNCIFERKNDVLTYIDYIMQESNSLFNSK
jgi:hypothetical protein